MFRIISFQFRPAYRLIFKTGTTGIFVLLALLLNFSRTNAQTTVINIPSTDVMSSKSLYVEFDVYSTPYSHKNGGSQSYYPLAVYGIGKNVEIGVNFVITDALAAKQPVEIQPNIKWQYYNNEKKGVAMTGGAILFTNITNRTGTDTFGMFYTNMSKKIKGTYGPRITAGGYGLVGRANGNGQEGGAFLGYEQPLHSKVSWVNDWYSGKNRFGYAATGLAFTPSSRMNFGVTYNFGNQGRGNHGLLSWVGYTF